MKNISPAHAIGNIDVHPTREKKKAFLIKLAHDYKSVINGKTIFSGRRFSDSVQSGETRRIAVENGRYLPEQLKPEIFLAKHYNSVMLAGLRLITVAFIKVDEVDGRSPVERAAATSVPTCVDTLPDKQ